MIPLTLLCLALFALALGCYSAWQRAQANAEHWFQRAADLETQRWQDQQAAYRRPMSCRLNTPRFDTVWLSEAALLRELGCGEVSE